MEPSVAPPVQVVLLMVGVMETLQPPIVTEIASEVTLPQASLIETDRTHGVATEKLGAVKVVVCELLGAKEPPHDELQVMV